MQPARGAGDDGDAMVHATKKIGKGCLRRRRFKDQAFWRPILTLMNFSRNFAALPFPCHGHGTAKLAVPDHSQTRNRRGIGKVNHHHDRD